MRIPYRAAGPPGILALLALHSLLAQAGDGPAPRGREAEGRFPPLKLPEGFSATLFASDPLIEYPSVLAPGPRRGSIFLAHDYMTGLGTEIVRRDEIRLVEDTDGDGYADQSTLFAAGLSSIQGLAYHMGAVYAMHAPFLTVLRDANGDGAADSRRDLLSGLGWPPEVCPDRLHCANGLAAGHDGWLYLALGDRGCKVERVEGDRLVLNGGGILRCRADGRDLHVFATGLRNIYDVVLDEELNVFVRDNENDGGTYKIRLSHSFFGADHGYPYLYEERPDEVLPPLADLGLGSSAGGVCYLETAFPVAYRGDLFFCEWGRSVVRYRREPAGASFAPVKEIEFVTGGDSDPYGFKPTDAIVDRDGALIVADWADGQRPKRGRGRVYRISHGGSAGASAAPGQERSPEEWVEQLSSASQHARNEAQAEIERRGEAGRRALTTALLAGRVGVLGRLHAVWIIARPGGREPLDLLLRLVESDPDPRVRAQAVRVVADLVDPVLEQHQLQAGRGDPEIASRLAALGRGQDERVVLEVVTALGRLRWAGAAGWLRENPSRLDPALAHAGMQTLRRSQNWPAILGLLDEPDTLPVRALAVRAIAAMTEPTVVEGLIERLRREGDARRRSQYADALTRIYRRPGAWVYWGFRPGPRPANTEAWELSALIARALDQALADPDLGVRAAVLKRMEREKVPVEPATLVRWLREERDTDRVASILESLREAPAGEVRKAAAEVAAGTAHTIANRLAALSLFARAASAGQLLGLAGSIEDSLVLAEALRLLGKRHELESRSLLLRGLGSPLPEVKVAAIESLAELQVGEAGPPVLGLLQDPDMRVKRAAAGALGELGAREAADALLGSAVDRDAALRRQSLDALRRLREPRALPLAVAAMRDHETELDALECLAEIGGPEQAPAIAALAAQSRSLEILNPAVRALTRWGEREPAAREALDRMVAAAQGASGVLLCWKAPGPVPAQGASGLVERSGSPAAAVPDGWQTVLATGSESSVTLPQPRDAASDSVRLAGADFLVAEPTPAQFLASSSGTLQVWLNGRPVHDRREPGTFRPDSDRFDADVTPGMNRVVVQVAAASAPRFHVRFRRRSSTAEHERLTQLALTTSGEAVNGRAVFLSAQKSACIKCHRLGGEGGSIGPELTGVGRRFSRIHLIESILEPSRTIAASFQGHVVRLKDGRVLTGVRTAETPITLTLGDQEGQSHVLEKAQIEEEAALTLSIMPEGLEKGLTEKEFVDLIAFLAEER